MKSRFVISGLMRSGTAWCSALISLCPNAFCLHEGEAIYRRGLTEYLENRPEKFCGDAASTNKDGRLDLWAEKRVAIIRPLDDVIKSCMIAFHGLIPEECLYEDAVLLRKWVNDHNPMVIMFGDLFTVDTARTLWEYLLPGELFPTDKVAALCRTRVEQVIPPRHILQQALNHH